MKLITFARSMGAAFALVILGFAAHAVLVTPPVQGPYLGDNNTNLYTLQQAVSFNNQMQFATVIPTLTTQAGCIQLSAATNQVNGSLSNGSVCLPAAVPGREIFIANNLTGGVSVNIFSSNNPAVVGTADTINGTAGSSAYTGLSTGKNSQCFSPSTGAWFCSSGS